MKTPKEIVQVPVESLIPYALNARVHNEHQVSQIASSIREFGFTNPLLIDGENNVIAGHGRLLAAKKLQLAEVPCIRLTNLTDTQRKAYVLVDNKLALNSSWDDELLKVEIQDLKTKDFDTDLLGWIQLPEFEAVADYSVLEDDEVEAATADMAKDVKKAIQIEFDLEHYEEAAELVKFWRDREAYVGGMIVGFLRQEKNKLTAELDISRRRTSQNLIEGNTVKVIAMGGEPATGKTTLMFQLISMTDDWKICKPQKLLNAMYSEKLNLYILGKYVNDGNVFQGTDRLSMAVQPDADKFFTKLWHEHETVNVIFEGDRLFNGKMLDRLRELFPESLKVLILTASHNIKEQRHVYRKDDQDDKFKNSRATKISNIMGSPMLIDYIDTMINENLDDQTKIIDNIVKFYNWKARGAQD